MCQSRDLLIHVLVATDSTPSSLSEIKEERSNKLETEEQAIDEELQARIKNKTWNVIELPESRNQ